MKPKRYKRAQREQGRWDKRERQAQEEGLEAQLVLKSNQNTSASDGRNFQLIWKLKIPPKAAIFPCLKIWVSSSDSLCTPFGFLFIYGIYGERVNLGQLMESMWRFTCDFTVRAFFLYLWNLCVCVCVCVCDDLEPCVRGSSDQVDDFKEPHARGRWNKML